MTMPTITENQLLWLSGIISNKASELTDLPITESEDCRLALMLGQWLRDLGVSVEESQDGEPIPMNDDYDNDIAPLPKADDASYSEEVMIPLPEKYHLPLLTVDELIQAMRNRGTLAEVRKLLEKLREKDPASYNVLCKFYGK